MPLSPADVLAGRYRLDEPFAAGGMGEVWRAADTVLDRPVAVKLLRTEHADDPDFRRRFRNEARHAAQLSHPGVTQVYDFGDGGDGEPPYLVMEYVAGRTLSSILEEHGSLDEQRIWSIVGQTAAALAAAHRAGVVHGDVKPANLIVGADDRVKVTDFGVARLADRTTLTDPGLLVGTAQYLSPEQIAGEPASPASDVYALGVLAYACLAGGPPFVGSTREVLASHQYAEPPELPPGVSPGLRSLVTAMLAKDPAARPADVAAIAAQAQRRSERPILLESSPAPYPDEPPTAPGTQAAGDGAESTRVLSTEVPAAEMPAAEAPAAEMPAAEMPAAESWRRFTPPPRRMALLGIALAVVGAVVAAVMLLVQPGGRGSSPQAGGSQQPSSSAPTPVAVHGAQLFHPGGSGSDHPEEVPLAVDGKPATAWMTQHYASAAFGNLRPGVGLVVEAQGSEVRSVTVHFARAGVAARLYSGDGRAGLLGGQPLARTTSAPADWKVSLPRSERSRYWLVWITRLVPDGGGYRAGIGEIELAG